MVLKRPLHSTTICHYKNILNILCNTIYWFYYIFVNVFDRMLEISRSMFAMPIAQVIAFLPFEM